jgi:hypothetical protein
MNDIVVAILTALAGFVVWIIQRNVERRETARLRRERLYTTLLSACVEFAGTGNGAPFIFESQRAWLYASDEVLREINEYLKAFVAVGRAEGHKGDHQAEWSAVRDAEARMRSSIRKELFPKTTITPDWVKGEWELVTSRPERIQEYLRRGSSLPEVDDTPSGSPQAKPKSGAG